MNAATWRTIIVWPDGTNVDLSTMLFERRFENREDAERRHAKIVERFESPDTIKGIWCYIAPFDADGNPIGQKADAPKIFSWAERPQYT